jgi:hypothetical protein
MATLSLIRRGAIFDRTLANASPLISWLQGNWGLLFSHPDDFAQQDLEADRWTALVQDAFTQARVRPLTLVSGARRDSGTWITQMQNGKGPVLILDTPRHLRSDFVDMNSDDLRRALCRAPSRFVMMIDASLRLRRTFAYSLQDRLPSLLDFAATVDKLRTQSRRGDDEDGLAHWLARESSGSQVLRYSRQERAYA